MLICWAVFTSTRSHTQSMFIKSLILFLLKIFLCPTKFFNFILLLRCPLILLQWHSCSVQRHRFEMTESSLSKPIKLSSVCDRQSVRELWSHLCGQAHSYYLNNIQIFRSNESLPKMHQHCNWPHLFLKPTHPMGTQIGILYYIFY